MNDYKLCPICGGNWVDGKHNYFDCDGCKAFLYKKGEYFFIYYSNILDNNDSLSWYPIKNKCSYFYSLKPRIDLPLLPFSIVKDKDKLKLYILLS